MIHSAWNNLRSDFSNCRKAMLLVCLLMLFADAGCSRAKYRRQADEEANALIDSKSIAAGIQPGGFRIDVDPRSRMYNPNDPDCEPMPPDDPTSNVLMHCVDCKRGSKCWKCLPKTPFVENPSWSHYLPYNEKGEVVLDLEGAVQAGLLHSNRYQSELEELYLSALDVSFERFRFDTQFYGGSSIFYTADGRDRTGTGQPSSLLEVSPSNPFNRIRAERLTATGGEIVAGFANSFVWQFAGPTEHTTNTILDFSILQPLLRAGGRTRVLERLTISERALLANVREMDRFRETFYVFVVTGVDPGAGPSRRGGIFGGAGLTGFTGVGGGGFGRVGGGGGGAFGFGGGGGGFTGGAGAQAAGGYLGLLQVEQNLRNQYANVASLRDSVEQLQATHEAGRIDRFQVDLARQALYNAQSQLLTFENQYQAFRESFLIDLGLPPELEARVQDPAIDDLNLLDPQLEEVRAHVSVLLGELRELRDEQIAGPPAPGVAEELPLEELVPPPAPLGPAEQELRLRNKLAESLADTEVLLEVIEERLTDVRRDFQKLERALPQRKSNLQKLATREEVREANISPALFDTDQLDLRVARLEREFANLEMRLAQSGEQLNAIVAEDPENGRELLMALIESLTALSGELLELSLVQASVRLEAVAFEPVDLTPEQALAIASAYRQDWMNARAILVDTWRLIYFNANDLLSDLNIVFSGDIGNVGTNPLNLQGSRGRLRVGLEFDAPLTRLAERNLYRQSIIEYQQARRNYYQFRDRIYLNLRNTLRQIRLNEVNFELRRAAVQLAITQVDLTQLRLSEPPRPGEVAQFDSTMARDLVQALGDLLNVQNDFLSVWVNNEVQRLTLELDLGVMEIAPNGLRVENPMPLQTFLVNLPYSVHDMGLALDTLDLGVNLELLQPETLSPVPPEGEDEAPGRGPMPLPVPAGPLLENLREDR